MRPIIFVRTSFMKYYKGTDGDTPVNGGSYIAENGTGHECYNFDAVEYDDGTAECYGFAMLAGGGNAEPQLKIENIVGCEAFKKEEAIDNVIVVWCAKEEKNIRVVGFYKNATVFRYSKYLDFENGYRQWFNFVADKKDCVLLPYQERFSSGQWFVPTSGKNGYDFGFGRSSIWYGGSKTIDKDEIAYVETMIKNIESYNGENWIDVKGE